MAEDKLNEGSEEEKNSFNDSSDDDFGLPDLEFDELQELDMSFDDDDEEEASPEPVAPKENQLLPGSDDIDMSALDDIEIPDMPNLESPSMPDIDLGSDSVIDEGIEEVEDVLDSAQLISDRLGDNDFAEDLLSPEPVAEAAPIEDMPTEISFDDLMGDTDLGLDSDLGSMEVEDDLLPSGDDLLAGIDSPDDLAALGFADEEETAISEASDVGGSSLFSADEEDSIFSVDTDNLDFAASLEDSNMGSVENQEGKLPDSYKPYSYKESSGGFTKVIVIGVVVIGVIAAGLLFLTGGQDASDKVAANVEKKKKTIAKKKAAEIVTKVKEDDFEEAPITKVEKPVEVVPEPVAANTANPGDIEMIKSVTGQSYIIIGSFIDEDLAMDYAEKLSEEGNGVKLIYPYGKSKRYRVSIADFSTYGDAASQLTGYQGEFGDQVWALKY
ncbi:MAG: SPOR domain-containing protein [Reichenbachiella sp.]